MQVIIIYTLRCSVVRKIHSAIAERKSKKQTDYEELTDISLDIEEKIERLRIIPHYLSQWRIWKSPKGEKSDFRKKNVNVFIFT